MPTLLSCLTLPPSPFPLPPSTTATKPTKPLTPEPATIMRVSQLALTTAVCAIAGLPALMVFETVEASPVANVSSRLRLERQPLATSDPACSPLAFRFPRTSTWASTRTASITSAIPLPW